MGKCNCDTPRVQKNRYNPCTNETEASVQYYNKDQILAMIQEIMADKSTLTVQLSNILANQISTLQDILADVSEKENTLREWIEGFIATQYSQLFNEILIYLTGVANGTTPYDPNVIEGYISQLEELDPEQYPWAADLIAELNALVPEKDGSGDSYVYTVNKGIKSIAYSWAFSESSEVVPSIWIEDELAVNQARASHPGEWLWTKETITYSDDTTQDLYTHEFIPAEGWTCTITRQYGTTIDETGLPQPATFYNTISEALHYADVADNYVFCEESSTIQIEGQETRYESFYYCVMRIVRDPNTGDVYEYNSDPIWEWDEDNSQWEATEEYTLDYDIINSIIEYYQALLNETTEYTRISEITGYISMLRNLYSGNLNWVEAVSQYPTSFENENENGLIDDLRKALETLDPVEYADLLSAIEDFINWYELIKTFCGNAKDTSSVVEQTAGTISFNDKDWLTAQAFDEGVQAILDKINEVGNAQEECSCKTPIEALRLEIETLKGSIEGLKNALGDSTPTPAQETDVPCYVAMPYFRRPCFQYIAEKRANTYGCGPGWFPITPMAFATQEDAAHEKENWENGNNGDVGGMGYNRPDLNCSISVSDVTYGGMDDGKYYIWIESFTFNGETFEFPFVSAFIAGDSFSLNPFTIKPAANAGNPDRILTTNEKYVGLFKGLKNLQLAPENIPSHTHGEKIAGSNEITNILTTSKSGKHSHNVKWGDNNYTSDTSHYYVGKTSGGQTFMSKTQAQYKMAVDTWYGQGKKPGEIANSGFVQLDGEHTHTLTIPYFGEGAPFSNTPYAYFAPFIIRLPVPEGIELKRKYDVATNY